MSNSCELGLPARPGGLARSPERGSCPEPATKGGRSGSLRNCLITCGVLADIETISAPAAAVFSAIRDALGTRDVGRCAVKAAVLAETRAAASHNA